MQNRDKIVQWIQETFNLKMTEICGYYKGALSLHVHLSQLVVSARPAQVAQIMQWLKDSFTLSSSGIEGVYDGDLFLQEFADQIIINTREN